MLREPTDEELSRAWDDANRELAELRGVPDDDERVGRLLEVLDTLEGELGRRMRERGRK